MKFSSYDQFKYDLPAYGIEYAAEHAKACGFEGVELLDPGLSPNGLPFFSESNDLPTLKKALQKNGLKVVCYSAYADVFAENKKSILSKIQHMIDCAEFLEAPMFHHTIIPRFRSLPPANAPSYDEVFEEALERVCAIVDYCRQKGITCIYEPQGFYFNGVEGLGRLLNALQRENIGFCADMGNSLLVDEDPLDVFAALANWARHVHLKDFSISDHLILGSDQYPSRGGKYIRDAVLFEGSVQIAECLKVLKTAGYNGFASFEFRADDATTAKLLAQLQDIWNKIE